METPEVREPLSAEVISERARTALAQLTRDSESRHVRTKPQEIPSYELQRIDFAREVLEGILRGQAVHDIPDLYSGASYKIRFEGGQNE